MTGKAVRTSLYLLIITGGGGTKKKKKKENHSALGGALLLRRTPFYLRSLRKCIGNQQPFSSKCLFFCRKKKGKKKGKEGNSYHYDSLIPYLQDNRHLIPALLIVPTNLLLIYSVDSPAAYTSLSALLLKFIPFPFRAHFSPQSCRADLNPRLASHLGPDRFLEKYIKWEITRKRELVFTGSRSVVTSRFDRASISHLIEAPSFSSSSLSSFTSLSFTRTRSTPFAIIIPQLPNIPIPRPCGK